MSEQIAYVGDTSGDEFLDVTFYTKLIDDKEVEFVNIKVPGDKTLGVDEQVSDSHKRRFARKYSAYRKMQGETGTPVEEWTDVPEGLRRELAYLGFKFIEQVAGAPDSAFARVMGGVQWRLKAQSFLNRGKIGDNDVIKRQQEELDQLKAMVATLMADKGEDKPKRGRPKAEE